MPAGGRPEIATTKDRLQSCIVVSVKIKEKKEQEK